MGKARIIEEPEFDNPEEERLSRNYASAKMVYDCLWMANTAGLTPIQQAKQTLEFRKAKENWHKSELAMQEYVEKTYV